MLVSVVMAVYNGEKFIEEAINSILNQSYTEFELIIVNDGSTDSTRIILDAIQDDRVKIIHVDSNQGAAACLNLGIEHATGEWIAIHDADDISDQFRLEEQVNYIVTHPNCIGVSSLINGRIGNETVNNSEIEYYNTILQKEHIYNYRLFTCYLCHGSVIFSKKAFYDAGRYNPRYKISYDYDLWLRMFDISPIEKIPKVLYHYRLREDSLGKRNSKDTIAELLTISSTYVYNFIHKKIKKPSLTIIGSKKGCSFYKEHVGHKFRKVNYVRVSSRKNLKKLNNIKKKGKTQAILILNNRKSDAVLKHIKKRSSFMKKKLFKIWNYRF